MNWKERLREGAIALGTLPGAIGLAYKESPGYTVLMVVTRVLTGILPLIVLWASKMVIDGIVGLAGSGADFQEGLHALAPVLALYVLLTVTGEVGATFSGLGQQTMGDRVLGRVNVVLMEKAIRLPDLAPFESPDFHDALRNAREGISTRPVRVLDNALSMLESTLACVGVVALLGHLQPLLPLLVLSAVLPSWLAQMQLFKGVFDVFRGQAADTRRLAYYDRLLIGDEAAKEMRLYGLGPHLMGRYRALAERMFRRVFPAMRRYCVRGSLGSLFEAAVVGTAYGLVVYWAVQGRLTIGDLSMYAGAISHLQGNLFMVLASVSRGYEDGLYLKGFFDFLKRQPAIHIAPSEQARPAPSSLASGLEIRGLSFRYPGTDRFVLRDLNLYITPGQTVALVGLNGSGKTTLIKLLTRLYDPTEGGIFLDGRDIRTYDLESLRLRMAVIFQDFCRYHATARDNIAFGHIESRGDMEKVRQAAIRGQAAPLIEGLSGGYETMLGKRFDGGVDLSGGEWQKIALSRAFMRDAPILILDEPSAALDVETEYEIYRRSSALMQGRTTLLISHRFTTVRMATRILVLEDGRIVEDGAHEALLAQKGRYAEMFNAQAERYR